MKRWADHFGARVGRRRDHEEVGRPFWGQGRQQEGTMKRWDDRFGARVGSRRGP